MILRIQSEQMVYNVTNMILTDTQLVQCMCSARCRKRMMANPSMPLELSVPLAQLLQSICVWVGPKHKQQNHQHRSLCKVMSRHHRQSVRHVVWYQHSMPPTESSLILNMVSACVVAPSEKVRVGTINTTRVSTYTVATVAIDMGVSVYTDHQQQDHQNRS
jgi:uncharacterized protein YecE (DUF72 family)